MGIEDGREKKARYDLLPSLVDAIFDFAKLSPWSQRVIIVESIAGRGADVGRSAKISRLTSEFAIDWRRLNAAKFAGVAELADAPG